MVSEDSFQKRDSFNVGINAFVLREGKLLLGERINDEWPSGNGWGLPGGHFERGESMKFRASQELEEETGLHAEDFEFAALSNNDRGDVHYIQIAFLAKGVEGKEPEVREPDKCREWKWFALGELPEDIFIGHQGLIEVFLNNKQFIDS